MVATESIQQAIDKDPTDLELQRLGLLIGVDQEATELLQFSVVGGLFKPLMRAFKSGQFNIALVVVQQIEAQYRDDVEFKRSISERPASFYEEYVEKFSQKIALIRADIAIGVAIETLEFSLSELQSHYSPEQSKSSQPPDEAVLALQQELRQRVATADQELAALLTEWRGKLPHLPQLLAQYPNLEAQQELARQLRRIEEVTKVPPLAVAGSATRTI